MKKKNYFNVVVLALCILSMIGLTNAAKIHAEDTPYADVRVEGNGIVLTQDEAKNLTDEEILAKGNFEAYDIESGQKREVEFKAEWLSDRFTVSDEGDFLGFNLYVKTENQDYKLANSQYVKVVVLGTSIINVGSVSSESGDTYVKLGNNNIEISYSEYQKIMDIFDTRGRLETQKSEEWAFYLNGWYVSDELERQQASYIVYPDMNIFGVPQQARIAHILAEESKEEFQTLLNLDNRGGTVTLVYEFEEPLGNVKFNPQFTITILPEEAPEVTSQDNKVTPPNTGDNTNRQLGYLVILSAIAMAAILIKKTSTNRSK